MPDIRRKMPSTSGSSVTFVAYVRLLFASVWRRQASNVIAHVSDVVIAFATAVVYLLTYGQRSSLPQWWSFVLGGCVFILLECVVTWLLGGWRLYVEATERASHAEKALNAALKPRPRLQLSSGEGGSELILRNVSDEDAFSASVSMPSRDATELEFALVPTIPARESRETQCVVTLPRAAQRPPDLVDWLRWLYDELQPERDEGWQRITLQTNVDVSYQNSEGETFTSRFRLVYVRAGSGFYFEPLASNGQATNGEAAAYELKRVEQLPHFVRPGVF